MKNPCWWAVAIVIGMFVFAGCKRGSAPGVTTGEAQAFENASPELKQAWAAALEAEKANDYMTTQRLLFGLLRQQPTAGQTEAIQKHITSSRERLTVAAAAGDTSAQSALQQLRQNPPNRQR